MKTDKKYRPLIYICSPYSGDIAGNTKEPSTSAGSRLSEDRFRWHRS